MWIDHYTQQGYTKSEIEEYYRVEMMRKMDPDSRKQVLLKEAEEKLKSLKAVDSLV